MSDQPIADHALLSDSHSAGLIDKRGSVEWWCPPRFDSPSVFARLLDDDAGHFLIAPTAVESVTRRYRDGTLVLVTTFTTATGTLEVSDALAFAAGTRGHSLGQDSPHALLRRAVCTAGTVNVAVEFVPRFEYGLTLPLVLDAEGGVLARGGSASLRLSSPDVTLSIENAAAFGSVNLDEGQSAAFACHYASSWDPPPDAWDADGIAARLEDTIAAWKSWEAQHQRYDGPYADLVHHSGRVLQGLTYQPTGAMVAAPTTSLPEVIGGERNWDYRYAWVRDASFTLNALWIAGCPDEAQQFLDYLTTAASSFRPGADLQIMFGIGGERDLTERSLTHLRGWRDSAPVRVGNGAWQQRQIDVYGELLDAVHRLRDQIGVLEQPQRTFLISLADTAATVWREKDQGIWEVRGEPQHYVYSKLMCWVALERALAMAGELGAAARVEDWTVAQEQIRDAIIDEGWSDTVGAFTQSFESDELDASNLVMAIEGFLPADDPRMLATIDAIERDLTDERGLVYRYRAEDGLEGEEGTFLLCTFWLAEALAYSGQVDRAREVFERAISHCNDVELLAEEVDATDGALLGNFPQAFSHVGLVNAAWAIAQPTS